MTMVLRGKEGWLNFLFTNDSRVMNNKQIDEKQEYKKISKIFMGNWNIREFRRPEIIYNVQNRTYNFQSDRFLYKYNVVKT